MELQTAPLVIDYKYPLEKHKMAPECPVNFNNHLRANLRATA